MATIRPKTLTCPSCRAPVPVRNILKAKLVVCRNCDNQLDLTQPDFAALGKVRGGEPPQDAICLGLKGKLHDGRTIEIVGRIRFTDSDAMESWFWDEWLILVSDGSYLWLAEDEGRLVLNTPFTPSDPPDMLALECRRVLELDGARYKVRERGTPTICYVEGELTWRAKVGDTVSFVDARGPAGSIGVEYTPDEIEFFKRERLSRKTTLRMFGLDEVLELEKQRYAIERQHTRRARALLHSAFIMLAGGMFAFALFVCLNASITIDHGVHVEIPLHQLASTEIGATKLEAGQDYRLRIAGQVQPVVQSAQIDIVDPSGKAIPLMTISNRQKRGEASHTVDFRAEKSGVHRLKLSGTADPTAVTSTAPTALPGTPDKVTDPAAFKYLSWSFSAITTLGKGYLVVGSLLFVFGFMLFVIALVRVNATRLDAKKKYREQYREMLAEIHRRHRIQGA